MRAVPVGGSLSSGIAGAAGSLGPRVRSRGRAAWRRQFCPGGPTAPRVIDTKCRPSSELPSQYESLQSENHHAVRELR